MRDGYLVETLSPTGWRRPNIVHYRYRDADSYARSIISDRAARAIRILSFRVTVEPLCSVERDDDQLLVDGV